MVDKLPAEFGAALGRIASANLFMFAQLFKTLIDKNIIGDDDLRKFLNVEDAGWGEKEADRPTEYLPELLVMVERLRSIPPPPPPAPAPAPAGSRPAA